MDAILNVKLIMDYGICECQMCSAADILPKKPKGQKRLKIRRNVVQDMYGKQMKTEAAITKTVYDPMNKLSEKEFDRLASGVHDGMHNDVPYSMHKHKIWEVTPHSLLQNTKNPDAEILVLERKLTHHCSAWYYRHNECNFRFAHFTDKDGNLVKKTSARMGTKLKNILIDHSDHDKSKDCECCRSWNEDPRVEYRIFTPHENQWITTGQITGGGHERWLWPAFVRCHWKRNYLNHMDNLSEFEEEKLEYDYQEEWEDSDSEEVTESYRDRRFCLGDFIVEKPLNLKEWVIVP